MNVLERTVGERERGIGHKSRIVRIEERERERERERISPLVSMMLRRKENIR